MKKEEWKPYEGWEKLEGKVVSYIYEGREFCKGKVVLIDADIGITVIKEDEPDLYLCCLVLPDSPKWDKKWNKSNSRKKFNIICEMIDKGEYIYGETRKRLGEVQSNFDLFFHLNPTAESCPFM